MRGSIAGALLAVVLAQAASAAPFDDGLAAYFNGNYAGALRLWIPLADEGNANARNNVGIMYENGQGVSRDYAEAVRLYRLAAECGHADAQLNLGLMVEDGRGASQDVVRAYMWFTVSAAISAAGMLWSGLGAIAARDRVAAKMTPAQIAQAQDLARKCQESNYTQCEPLPSR